MGRLISTKQQFEGIFIKKRTIMKIRMKFNPPYPTLGRQLQIIARVLDTDSVPGITKKLEHLANDPSINLDSLIDAIEQVFKLPFEYPKVCSGSIASTYNICEEFIQQLKEDFFIINQTNINRWPPETFPNRNELYKSFIPFICGTIYAFVKELFKDDNFTNRILLTETPLQDGLNTILKKCPQFIDCFHNTERDKVQRWLAGKQLPNMGNLFDVINKAKDVLGCHYILCCEIAFASQLLQKTAEIAEPVYKIQDYFKSLIENSSSNSEDFKYDNIHLGKCSLLQKHFICAQDGVRYCAQQNPPTTILALEQFARVCATLQINSIAVEWRFNLLWVLSLIYEGKFDEALETLKTVMPNLFYTTDIIHTAIYVIDPEKKKGRSFFHIALALGAICEDRPFLKMMKTYGVIFGLFGKPMDVIKESYNKFPYVNKDSRSIDVIVEDWEVEQWANDFFILFSEKDVKNIESIKDKKTDVHLPLFIEWGKEPKVPVKPYKTPFKISWKTYPQLVWFTQMNDVDAVKTLLDANVDVNALSSSGESALLFSIESMVYNTIPFKPKEGKEIFHLIASHPHDRKTLLTPTNKKKLTCLGQAILTGEVDVVQKLIEMGADVNQIQSTDQQSPLYRAIQYSTMPNIIKHFQNPCSWTPEMLDGIRRGNEFFRNMTNEEVYRSMLLQKNNPMLEQAKQWVAQHFEEQRQKCLSKEKMFSIAKVLLENDADPNQRHDVNGLIGYTPLMMAAEKNLIDLFELMIKHGGNPNQTARDTGPYSSTISCWEIAYSWKSNSILKYLEENRDRFK